MVKHSGVCVCVYVFDFLIVVLVCLCAVVWFQALSHQQGQMGLDFRGSVCPPVLLPPLISLSLSVSLCLSVSLSVSLCVCMCVCVRARVRVWAFPSLEMCLR